MPRHNAPESFTHGLPLAEIAAVSPNCPKATTRWNTGYLSLAGMPS